MTLKGVAYQEPEGNCLYIRVCFGYLRHYSAERLKDNFFSWISRVKRYSVTSLNLCHDSKYTMYLQRLPLINFHVLNIFVEFSVYCIYLGFSFPSMNPNIFFCFRFLIHFSILDYLLAYHVAQFLFLEFIHMYENAYFGMIPDPFTIEHYKAENPGREDGGRGEEVRGEREMGKGGSGREKKKERK